jgi:hypothetical protein
MGQNGMRNEIGFENLVETLFKNGKPELLILFQTGTNEISHSFSFITITTKPLNIIHFLENPN